MNDSPNWIKLWLIYRTIEMPCPISWLVKDVSQEHFGFWDFPTRDVLAASEQMRIAELRECVAQGHIELYSDSRFSGNSCAATIPLAVTECDFSNHEFLTSTQAVATKLGYDLWEVEFQPDWSRYWHFELESENSGDDRRLRVIYASDTILQDLCRWLPDYDLYDKCFGLRETSCHTIFQHQVNFYKVLPFAKMICWTARLDNSFATIAASVNKDSNPTDIAANRLKISEYFRDIGDRQQAARRVLNQISRKWECFSDPKRKDQTYAVERTAACNP